MAPISPILEFTDDELFTVESDIIKHIATEESAVIIGRCGFNVLRQHPNHVSIFSMPILNLESTGLNWRIIYLMQMPKK